MTNTVTPDEWFRDLDQSLKEALSVHDPAACQRASCGRCKPSGKPALPPRVDAQHQGPTATPDPVVRSIGLPRHPTPHDLAKTLRECAKALEEHGLDAIDLVADLASRGFSGSTLGDGGSRGNSELTPTEAATARNVPGRDDDTGKPLPRHPEARWYDADRRYASLLRDLNRLAGYVKSRTDEILRHASDEDRTVTGSGECMACARYCTPDGDRPGNRLRAGLCPTCYRAWRRYQLDDGPLRRAEWVAQRREGFTERNEDATVKAIHTPEPDHDIDLTTEKAPNAW